MNESMSYKLFRLINCIIMLFIIVVTLFPFLHLLAISFSDQSPVLRGEVSLLPVGFNLRSYEYIVNQADFWGGYRNTIIYTVLGTGISLTLTILCAYPLSRSHLKGKSVILRFIVFTMFFTGGLIPTYLLVANMNMVDTIWAMVVPGAISAYNVIIMRTFFMNIAKELEDAAKIDGLNDFGVLLKVVLPLSKPIIATISLFVAINIWNDWFSALLFLSDNKLHPITMYLRAILMSGSKAAMEGQTSASGIQIIPQNLQAATVMMVTIPIILVYPFIQKYFVQGVMIGSIKG